MTEGKWVSREEMNPACNIAGRSWRTADGQMSGIYYGTGSIPYDAASKGIQWFFPDTMDEPEPKPRHPMAEAAANILGKWF